MTYPVLKTEKSGSSQYTLTVYTDYYHLFSYYHLLCFNVEISSFHVETPGIQTSVVYWPAKVSIAILLHIV